MGTEYEQAEADILRVAWMAEVGMDPHDIATSLRHNRPQSAAKEQDLLDVVRKQLEWKWTYDEAMGAGA
jgi:hypothetical protein